MGGKGGKKKKERGVPTPGFGAGGQGGHFGGLPSRPQLLVGGVERRRMSVLGAVGFLRLERLG